MRNAFELGRLLTHIDPLTVAGVHGVVRWCLHLRHCILTQFEWDRFQGDLVIIDELIIIGVENRQAPRRNVPSNADTD